MFGSLKRLFSSSPSERPERSIYFHEDAYCQIELLPVSTRQHCQTQMGIIDDFGAKHSQGDSGFSDIYVRPKVPRPFAELGISISALSTALRPHFPAYDSVFTGYSSYREKCKTALAWGGEFFTVFANYEADIIQHVWLDFGARNAAESERIALALRALPRSDSILIADWSWSLVAVLSDAESLNDYLRQRTKKA
jgi:hypothetical protein